MKFLNTLNAALIISLLTLQANAAVVTNCGDNVCFTYDDATLFGAGNVIGDNIFFLPTGFKVSSVDDEGGIDVNATINIDVAAIKNGFNMAQFMLLEQGDYLLKGAKASATAAGMLAVTSLTQNCGNLAPCREHDIFNVNPIDAKGALTDWEATAMVDLTSNGNWGSDSLVTVTLENRLSAVTLETGELAFSQKKIAGVGVTVVPVPASVWLFGSALAGLFSWRRRQGKTTT